MAGLNRGKVCIFGAGGPVGATVTHALSNDYILRLVDIADITEAQERQLLPGFPKPEAPAPPHEWWIADVTDYQQVETALSGCDAAINLTVNRTEPEKAFCVNVVGAYNIMKAAVQCQLQRVIHTGPVTVSLGYEGDYRYEFRIPDEAPMCSGTGLYELTKYLGLEVVTAFAERTGLDVITFLLSRLRPGNDFDGRDDNVVIPFSTAWEDLGEAFLCGLRAPRLPQPNEIFFICARLPMGKYSSDKAERLLGWKPKHNFERFYQLNSRDSRP